LERGSRFRDQKFTYQIKASHIGSHMKAIARFDTTRSRERASGYVLLFGFYRVYLSIPSYDRACASDKRAAHL